MKRLLLLAPFFLMSCEEEQIEPNQPTTCDCYKSEQQLAPQGDWVTINTTSTSIELCTNDGDTVYTSMVNRYIWHCQ